MYASQYWFHLAQKKTPVPSVIKTIAVTAMLDEGSEHRALGNAKLSMMSHWHNAVLLRQAMFLLKHMIDCPSWRRSFTGLV